MGYGQRRPGHEHFTSLFRNAEEGSHAGVQASESIIGLQLRPLNAISASGDLLSI